MAGRRAPPGIEGSDAEVGGWLRRRLSWRGVRRCAGLLIWSRVPVDIRDDRPDQQTGGRRHDVRRCVAKLPATAGDSRTPAGLARLVRLLALLAFSVWLGGFTFYSAMVIPVLHDVMDSTDAGSITQRVTYRLNALGIVALVGCAASLRLDRARTAACSRNAVVLLATSTGLLLFLVALHNVMDRLLAGGSLRGFYPLHRLYLVASTVQWFVNVGFMASFMNAGDRR